MLTASEHRCELALYPLRSDAVARAADDSSSGGTGNSWMQSPIGFDVVDGRAG